MAKKLNTTQPNELVRQAIGKVETHLRGASARGLTLAELMDSEGSADFPEDAIPLAIMDLRATGRVELTEDNRLIWTEEAAGLQIYQLDSGISARYFPEYTGFDSQRSASDVEQEFKRDRDRIIYSSELGRLAGITQVTAPESGLPISNRLTHSLKVGLVARQLTERLSRSESYARLYAAERYRDHLNPDMAEAAGLAHDMGHPPFGHIAEYELNSLMGAYGGFEGNAQTFRILTWLATGHYQGTFRGLNLTRGVLNGVLKYPWIRSGGSATDPHQKKFGSYQRDETMFWWARSDSPLFCEASGRGGDTNEQRSVIAEVMDWADDVTYAVHDLEDFYRAGLIPFGRLAGSGAERARFDGSLSKEIEKLYGQGIRSDAIESAKRDLFGWVAVALRQPYDGAHLARASLREVGSSLLSRFLRSVTLRPLEEVSASSCRLVEIEHRDVALVTLLKHLTRHYIIDQPALAALQDGHRKVIRSLWDYYMQHAVEDSKVSVLPLAVQLEVERAQDDAGRACVICDLVSGLTEQRSVELYRRITGIKGGSLLDATAG